MNEIQPTLKHILRIWWSLLWRNLLMIVVVTILGGILGIILGLVMGMMGFSVGTIRMVARPIGFLLGLGFSIFPLSWIIGKDFGSFRLIIVSKDPTTNLPAPPAPASDDWLD